MATHDQVERAAEAGVVRPEAKDGLVPKTVKNLVPRGIRSRRIEADTNRQDAPAPTEPAPQHSDTEPTTSPEAGPGAASPEEPIRYEDRLAAPADAEFTTEAMTSDPGRPVARVVGGPAPGTSTPAQRTAPEDVGDEDKLAPDVAAAVRDILAGS